jgi:hypothetical protein
MQLRRRISSFRAQAKATQPLDCFVAAPPRNNGRNSARNAHGGLAKRHLPICLAVTPAFVSEICFERAG